MIEAVRNGNRHRAKMRGLTSFFAIIVLYGCSKPPEQKVVAPVRSGVAFAWNGFVQSELSWSSSASSEALKIALQERGFPAARSNVFSFYLIIRNFGDEPMRYVVPNDLWINSAWSIEVLNAAGDKRVPLETRDPFHEIEAYDTLQPAEAHVYEIQCVFKAPVPDSFEVNISYQENDRSVSSLMCKKMFDHSKKH